MQFPQYHLSQFKYIEVMNKKLSLLIVVCAFTSCCCFSQVGYIGKRHEIGLEVFKTVAFNAPEITYRFAVAKNAVLFFNYGWSKASRDMKDIQYSNLGNLDQFGGSYGDFSKRDIKSGKLKA